MASSPIITNIDVANLALSYIGNTSQINSFSDQTAPSIVCGRFYDVSRVSLLKSYPWSFATIIDDLTVTTETDDKFTYVSCWEYKGESKDPVLLKEDLVFENIKLSQRSYK